MSNENITLLVAGWGAVLSTILAVAKGVKWYGERRTPLQIHTDAPVPLISGRTGVVHHKEFFAVYINNDGRPTTLGNLAFRYFRRNPIAFRYRKPDAAGLITFPEKFERLPAKLDSGDQWNQIIEFTPELKEMATTGYLYLQAVDSGTKKNHLFARTRLKFDPLHKPPPTVGPAPRLEND